MTHVIALSNLHDCSIDAEDDLRGLPMFDAKGNRLGTVDELMVDADGEHIRRIRLDDGKEYPAEDLEVHDGAVYPLGTQTAGHVVAVHRDIRLRRH